MRNHCKGIKSKTVILEESISNNNNTCSGALTTGCCSMEQMRSFECGQRVRRANCYENKLIGRSMPLLLIIVCLLIIANSKCDQVGSANGK